MESKTSWVKGKIEEGKYKGRTVEVQFGKPLKILVGGKDVTDVLLSLQISLDVDGQVIRLKLAELDYSQASSKAWEKMVEGRVCAGCFG